MSYKVGIDKQQLTFMPVCPDDYVPEDHICRVICAFTQQLDMVALGYKYAECKAVGCPPYDPRMMLNLYIYGYLHRIRSSRRLHAETCRNVEVMWLMEGLAPDDKTICNFRADNAKPLRETFRAFSRMCRELGLYGGETAAVDGTKIRANNSRKNNHNRKTVERELSRIDKRISEYLNALDEADAAEAREDAPTPSEIRAALEKLNQRKVKFEDFLTRLETESEISTVDPDARLMRSGGDARTLDVCYNVQAAVDAKHSLIADFDLADNSSDKGNLQNMAEKAMDVMETDALTVLADKGYCDGADIAACEQNGVTCFVAKPNPGGSKKAGEFSRDAFSYNPENDCYTCPCQNTLKFMRTQKHSNGEEYRVYANYSACSACPRRSECTKAKSRQILRSPYQDTLDAVDERTRNNREIYRRRQEIVEHPFGTVKAVWGYRQFLCRGKPKVSAETALAFLAYNLRRAVNIFAATGASLAAAMQG